MNSDADRSISYQKDSWRLAGFFNKWGKLPPPLFDRRDKARETSLISTIPIGKPWCAVHLDAVSSPIPHLSGLIEELSSTYPDYHFIDLGKTRAQRIFDMIGLLDYCELLVSVDSVYLHLSRAAKVPTMAIVNDVEAWRASIAPPATVASFGYSTVNTASVVQSVGEFINRRIPSVYHCANLFGQEERHLKAYQSWKKLKGRGMIGCYSTDYDQYFTDGERQLPYLRGVLMPAIEKAGDDDWVLWSNSDVSLKPEILDHLKGHPYEAVSFRRDDNHVGRDAVAGRKRWWLKHWHEIGYVLGAPQFDLALAAMIREEHGIISTLENISVDFYPADSDKRYIGHCPHEEGWQESSPSAIYNGRLFNEFLERRNWSFWK
jgi:hypothetical protein